MLSISFHFLGKIVSGFRSSCERFAAFCHRHQFLGFFIKYFVHVSHLVQPRFCLLLASIYNNKGLWTLFPEFSLVTYNLVTRQNVYVWQ